VAIVSAVVTANLGLVELPAFLAGVSTATSMATVASSTVPFEAAFLASLLHHSLPFSMGHQAAVVQPDLVRFEPADEVFDGHRLQVADRLNGESNLEELGRRGPEDLPDDVALLHLAAVRTDVNDKRRDARGEAVDGLRVLHPDRLELAREGLRPRPHRGLGAQAQGPERLPRLPRRLLPDDRQEGVAADASVDGREGQAIRRWIDRPRRVDRVPETVGLEVHLHPDRPRHVVALGERRARERRQESIRHGGRRRNNSVTSTPQQLDQRETLLPICYSNRLPRSGDVADADPLN
jgi:hypothetical protein